MNKPAPAFSLNGIKTFLGREGYGLNANILRDGKKVGMVMDSADGGEPRIDFVSREAEPEFYAFTAAWASTSGALAAHMAEFAALGVRDRSADYQPSAQTVAEIWIDHAFDAIETEKHCKRNAKTKTMFRLKGDPRGEWRTINEVSARVIAHITTKYGDKVETIYGQPA